MSNERLKKRILFVEEDQLLLQMYAMMLDGDRGNWDIATARSGRQAIELMEQGRFDVVVADMKLPGMTGIELLSEVRRHYPLASRIILSGLSDQEEIARSLDATHQFIPKPFDIRVLKATLNRICALDAYLHNEKLQALVSRLGTLPSFPSLYLEVTKELGSLNSSIESIAGIIAKDPGMTAKMLQIVNSAAIGLSRKVGSPFEAVQFLGMGTVRSLVLSAHIFSCFEHSSLKGFSVNDLWNHGMKTGQIACMIMQYEQADPAEVEDTYIAGMLHDIGKLMLADSLPEQFQQALSLAAQRDITLPEAEMEVFGATHAGVAAYLLGLWGLPAPIVEAVAFHHSPAQSDTRSFGPLPAVYVANALEHELSRTKTTGKRAELDVNYLAAVRIEKRIDNWRAEAAKLVKEG